MHRANLIDDPLKGETILFQGHVTKEPAQLLQGNETCYGIKGDVIFEFFLPSFLPSFLPLCGGTRFL